MKKDDPRRQKMCDWCKSLYWDESVMGRRKTCSRSCASRLSVKTQREKDCFERPLEYRKKISDTIKRHISEGIGHVAVCRERYGVDNPFAAAEVQQKIRETNLRRYGVEHYTQTDIMCEVVTESNRTRTISDKTRRKMSLSASKRLSITKSWGKAGYREDIRLFCRSRWEANYVRILNYRGIKWEYEPERVEFEAGFSYHPDFRLEDGTFVEVKGWMDERSAAQVRLFREARGYDALVVIDDEKYKLLELEYAYRISEWEK